MSTHPPDRSGGAHPADPLPAHQLPTVDPTVLGRIVSRLGDAGSDFRDSLIDTWVAESAERRQQLRDAVANRDTRRMTHAAHALRSGSGALGAKELSAICGRVEGALRDGGTVDLGQALVDVESALDRAIAGLQALSDRPLD